MKYRSRTDIISILLQSLASGPQPKTKMMYLAYVSYKQLLDYLDYLQETGLIVYEKETHLSRITEKGLEFIRSYDDLKVLLVMPKNVI